MLGQLPGRDSLQKVWDIAMAKPYSMVNYPRLAKAYDLILESERYGDLEGAIVEPGCWNGGFARVMEDASRRAGQARQIWLFDSFVGGPKPSAIDVKITGKAGKGEPNGADQALCERAFRGVDPERLHIMKGWFSDTFPQAIPKIGKIAYLHLDADFYDSTKYCLEELYDLVVPGGLILFDDYSYYLGCKKAVDEFLTNRKVMAGLVMTVEHSAYFRKPL